MKVSKDINESEALTCLLTLQKCVKYETRVRKRVERSRMNPLYAARIWLASFP